MAEQIYRNAFRSNDWKGKAALLMGMVYLFSSWFSVSFSQFLILAPLSLMTIVGFACTGYLCNDYFDIRQDMIAGKRNFLIGKSTGLIILYFLFAFFLLSVPWLLLPKTDLSLALIGGQLLLFPIYSVPPVRFKERGLWGLVVDALYAHGLPPILAAYTFSLAAHIVFPGVQLICLFAWQFAGGMRNILLHQSADMMNDRKAGVRNFASQISTSGLNFAVKYLIILEVLLACTFFLLLIHVQPFFLLCLLTVISLSCLIVYVFGSGDFDRFMNSEWKFFPNNIYEKWLPPCYLLMLSYYDPKFLLILFIHTLLVDPKPYWYIYRGLYVMCHELYQLWKRIPFGTIFYAIYVPVRMVTSWIVNHLIFFIFLLFGVNLKKRNTSALDYIRGRKKST